MEVVKTAAIIAIAVVLVLLSVLFLMSMRQNNKVKKELEQDQELQKQISFLTSDFVDKEEIDFKTIKYNIDLSKGRQGQF